MLIEAAEEGRVLFKSSGKSPDMKSKGVLDVIKNHCGCWVENGFEAGLAWSQTDKMGGCYSNLGHQWWELALG